jgi:hypothetical protein
MITLRTPGILLRLAAAVVLAAASLSCGDVVRQGRSPVYLVIVSLQGARGANPGQLGTNLISDVLTLVTQPAPCTAAAPCPTFFADPGSVTLRTALKDVGTTVNPTSPTTNNDVTITRYRVRYRRTDGRNIEGVDVPYGFDSAVTGTVSGGTATTMGFTLVRNVAKIESPLAQLVSNAGIITTIAEVTFFGQDQVGNELNVTGMIEIAFGNFGD